jgi:hypothetical protein
MLTLLFALLLTVTALSTDRPAQSADLAASASTSQLGFSADSVLRGDRFSAAAGEAWEGSPDAAGWWWQAAFPHVRRVGALLQVFGSHPTRLGNAPRRYVWRASLDGKTWTDLPETAVKHERRAFRVLRLHRPVEARFLRLVVFEAEGAFPTLRTVELYEEPSAAVPFPEWAVVVSSTTRYEPVKEGEAFIPLVRSVPGAEAMPVQHVWLGDFDPDFIAAEPRPFCAFLSGSFRDWCEVEREPWRGTEQILKAGTFPMWASCGGAQGLAILAETGVDRPWDCPHCRDPEHPKLPIYTHIGHTAARPCGDYSACINERGPTPIRRLVDDPVFRGLPAEFLAVESHCGQIAWAPKGWELIAVGGEGAKTHVQCLRVRGRPIYAAQFHIELSGAPETSRKIMASFLNEARHWRRRQDR